MKYKVGQVVSVKKITPGTEVDWIDGDTLEFNRVMSLFPMVTIREVDDDMEVYNVEEIPYAYCENMIEKLADLKHDKRKS